MTPFSTKVEILAELWMTYKDEDYLKDFIKFNDMGLPLAYLISTEKATPTKSGMMCVSETFAFLIQTLELDSDTNFDSLAEMLSLSNFKKMK